MIPRSLLFVPGDTPSRFDKAAASGADAIILDLEDSVAPARKAEARLAVAAYLNSQDRMRRPLCYVRINPLSTSDALADLAAVTPSAPDGIMLPKAEGAGDIIKLDHYLSALETASSLPLGGTAVLPIAVETPLSLFRLGSYSDVKTRVGGLTWGAEDLPVGVGAAMNRLADGQFTDLCRLARTLCLAAASAAGLPAFETVYVDIKNLDGLRSYAIAGRHEGFAGMMAIHPSQVPIINDVFTPTESELENARRIVRLFDENPGLGVIAVEGKMIDMPHLKQALRLLARGGRGSGDAS